MVHDALEYFEKIVLGSGPISVATVATVMAKVSVHCYIPKVSGHIARDEVAFQWTVSVRPN